MSKDAADDGVDGGIIASINDQTKKHIIMSEPLQHNTLIQSVGNSVRSNNGNHLGTVSDLIKNKDSDYVEYLVLESDGFLDQKIHFFAIPASSAYVQLTESKNVILQLSKDTLYFARRITRDKLPALDAKTSSLLYELI